MQLSIRNRIALYFALTFSVMGSITSIFIYVLVKNITYLEIDRDLRDEVALHLDEFVVERDTFYFKNKNEWLEREHSEVEVYPVFMQLQKHHQVIDKSPNLKNDVLTFSPEKKYLTAFDAKVNERNIRQMQAPIRYDDVLLGEMIIAVPIDNAISVLQSLKSLLYFLLPINILVLFIVLRYITHLSIKPLSDISERVDNITSKNIKVKLKTSKNNDEIDRLSRSINKLLLRLQKALDGERNFAINASHELRTPLSVIKGKLEVLNRKERSSEEIKSKLNDVLKYVQQMDITIDQMLKLAEMSAEDRENLLLEDVDLCQITDEIRQDFQKELREKKLQLLCEQPEKFKLSTNLFYLNLILKNLIQNAIKYSHSNNKVMVYAYTSINGRHIAVKDNGIGMQPEETARLFELFYRSNPNGKIKGYGLGLPLVQKAAEILGAQINVESKVGSGSTFTLIFKN